MVKRYHFKLIFNNTWENLNLPLIQGYSNFFVNLGPTKKNIFFLIFTLKSHSNIYIGHIYQFNQLIINANNVLQ